MSSSESFDLVSNDRHRIMLLYYSQLIIESVIYASDYELDVSISLRLI